MSFHFLLWGKNGDVLNNVHATLFYVMKSGQWPGAFYLQIHHENIESLYSKSSEVMYCFLVSSPWKQSTIHFLLDGKKAKDMSKWRNFHFCLNYPFNDFLYHSLNSWMKSLDWHSYADSHSYRDKCIYLAGLWMVAQWLIFSFYWPPG